MNIVILGPQGSGKGTQAALVGKFLGIPHIDVGSILRDEAKKSSPGGLELRKFMDKGLLVPDALVIQLVKKRLSENDCDKGFILDGFPRTKYEAEKLDEFTDIKLVILLDVSDSVAVKHLSNRLQCEKCGTIYGLTMMSQKKDLCDKCGGKLVQRADDTPSAIRNRLKIYHKEIKLVVEHYKDILQKIDASGSVDAVFNEIKRIIA